MIDNALVEDEYEDTTRYATPNSKIAVNRMTCLKGTRNRGSVASNIGALPKVLTIFATAVISSNPQDEEKNAN